MTTMQEGPSRRIDGAELYARRLALGLSQEALGLVLGTTQAAVSRWERGARPVGALVDAERAALEEQQRREQLTQLARQRPLFRKIDGYWWLVGADLSAGQRVEVATRTGGARVVKVLHVLSLTGQEGLVKATFRDWTAADEAGHDTLVRFVADSYGTEYPRRTVGQTSWIYLDPYNGWQDEDKARVVVSETARRIKDPDGDDGDEWGIEHTYVLTDPTPEQKTALRAVLQAEQDHRAGHRRAEQIHRHIITNSIGLDGMEIPVTLPEPMLCGKPQHGVGWWFVITDTHIWAITNNAMDGDDWSRNTVVTGGAGAIGHRIELDDDLAAEIRDLHAQGITL